MIRCTCCDEPARKQCLDHDTGYGVCDRCFAKHGRENFCHVPSCTAHRSEFELIITDILASIERQKLAGAIYITGHTEPDGQYHNFIMYQWPILSLEGR